MLRVQGVVRLLGTVALCVAATLVTPGRSWADPADSEPVGSDSGSVSEYVAMGDSYVAGPGIPDQTGLPLGCARSSHDYPDLVRATLHPARFRDVSCSGATTANLTGAQAVPGGSNPAQLGALTATTDLVTLGIGGNDIGFGQIIITCGKLSSSQPLGAACRDHYGQNGLAARIKAAGPKVDAVLAAIRKRAPHAQVLLVGYPTILPDSGPGCYPVVPFSPGDVAWLRETEKALNSMLAERAEHGGAEFVDTYRSSVGHDVCQLPGRKWVEGLLPTSPAAPAHPNALGMRNSAAAVLKAVDSSDLAGR
jgi:lysophospholipase L1-like esterase